MLYLEDFLEVIENVPQEVRDRTTELRELDLGIQNNRDQLEDKIKNFFSTAKKTKLPERHGAYEKIRDEYYKLLDDADEKSNIATNMADSVDRYIRKLDQEIEKFKYELEADNPGITETLEKRSLELDEPIKDSQKENRYKNHHGSRSSDWRVPIKREDSFANLNSSPPQSLSFNLAQIGTGGLGVGSSPVVEVADAPLPSGGEVRVRMHKGGVNFFDLYTCLGLNPSARYPCGLGLEGAGVVSEVGEGVEKVKVGDRVIVHCPLGGAFSELVTTKVENIQPVSDKLTMAEASSLTISYITAYFALYHAGSFSDNKTVFVHSVAGSVGIAVTQLAKLHTGTEVIGTTSAAKFDQVKEVDLVIPYENDYVSEVFKKYPKGVSLVIDCLAGKHFDNSMKMLRPFGKVVLIGAKEMIKFDGVPVAKTENVSPFNLIMNNSGATGLHINKIKEQEPELFQETWDKILQLASSRQIQPKLHKEFTLSDIRGALDEMVNRKNIGKITIGING